MNSEDRKNSQKSSAKFRHSFRHSPTYWLSKWSKIHRHKDLSAVFNMEQSTKGALVDINVASEEELMTLRGINRQLSKNIIEYRNKIGGFKKIEDLALVSGVGALVFQNIVTDVSVQKLPSAQNQSMSSHNTSSDSLLTSADSLIMSQKQNDSVSLSHKQIVSTPLVNGKYIKSSPQKIEKIDVNSATIFDLTNIRGMSQEMAANIVHYRTKKGSFKSIDEMVKVKGFNRRNLGLLKLYLTCDSCDSIFYTDAMSSSSSEKSNSANKLKINSVNLKGHKRSFSAPMNQEPNSVSNQSKFIKPNHQLSVHRFSTDFSADLFELLSLKSERPYTYDVFNGLVRGRKAIRVASWNLQNLCPEKINNPGVLEVICRTVLENGFSIIALQEIINPYEVLEKICGELNFGSLRRIREWGGPSRNWKWACPNLNGRTNHFKNSQSCAFMYNTLHDIELKSSTYLDLSHTDAKLKNSNLFTLPLISSFQVNDLKLSIASIHVKEERKNDKILEEDDQNSDCEEFYQPDYSESNIINGDKNAKTEVYGRTSENTMIDEGLFGRHKNSFIANGPSSHSLSDKLSANNCLLNHLVKAVKKQLEAEKYSIYLGSFGTFAQSKAFNNFNEDASNYVFHEDTLTDINHQHPNGSQMLDNICLSTMLTKFNTGSNGVIREGLNHMAIPRGWGWGGFVSNHCPIYVDLFTQPPFSRFKKQISQSSVSTTG